MKKGCACLFKAGKVARLLALFLILSCLALPIRAEKKKALFVWGGWEGHEPKKCVDIFAPWLEQQGFEVEISNTLDSYLDVEKLKSLDLIVQVFTMSTKSRAESDWQGGTAAWLMPSGATQNISSWSAASGSLIPGG